MATSAQLKTQLRDVEARLGAFAKEFEENPEITEDEKVTAWKGLQDDFTRIRGQLGRCEEASEIEAALVKGGIGEAVDTKTGKPVQKFEMPNPLSKYGRKHLAMLALEDEGFAALIGVNDVTRKAIEHSFEIGVKTPVGNAESDNVMGDLLLPSTTSGGGFTGPSAIGQNPFGTGAFAQGILPDFRPGIVETLFYQLTLADLISSFATTSPNISYLTEKLDNFQANQVNEAGTFPFSSLSVGRSYAQIGKVANAMTISDEAIADAATLYNFVQGRLLLGVERQEEVQILAGSGYPGVGGLLSFDASFTTAGSGSLYNGSTSTTVSNVAFPASGTLGSGVLAQTITSLSVGRVVTGAGTSYPDPLTVSLNLKDAAVDIELAVFQSPTAHIMHPRDWQRLETAQDANQQFMNPRIFGNVYGVSRGPVKSLWGVPVVTTPLMPAGYILTGWFDPQTVQVARRQGIQMQVTNSNESDFIQGKVTVRADSRLGLLCYRPTAFELTQLVAG